MSKNPIYAVIMAGGTGTRLWPLSRQKTPKQTLAVNSERSLFQLAVDRVRPILPVEQILVITASKMAGILAEQVPEIPAENYVIEPEGRGTAPVIALGAAVAEHMAGQTANIICLAADHYIEDVAGFQQALKAAVDVAERGSIVTLGIQPTHAATGFGYIESGAELDSAQGQRVLETIKFKEKPSMEVAEELVSDGKHFWNSGMFIWSTDRVRSEFESQLPETAALVDKVRPVIGTDQMYPVLNELWPTCPSETIDYGIMEGANDIAVIPISVGWNDVGSWSAILDVIDFNEEGNVVREGDHISINTSGTLVQSKKLVATIGVDDLIIIDTDDALLICAKDKAQDVKKVVDRLKAEKRSDLL